MCLIQNAQKLVEFDTLRALSFFKELKLEDFNLEIFGWFCLHLLVGIVESTGKEARY